MLCEDRGKEMGKHVVLFGSSKQVVFPGAPYLMVRGLERWTLHSSLALRLIRCILDQPSLASPSITDSVFGTQVSSNSWILLGSAAEYLRAGRIQHEL